MAQFQAKFDIGQTVKLDPQKFPHAYDWMRMTGSATYRVTGVQFVRAAAEPIYGLIRLDGEQMLSNIVESELVDSNE